MAAYYIDDKNVAAQWQVTATNASAHAFINGQNPLASPSYANNPTKRGTEDDWDDLPSVGIGASTYPPTSALTGVVTAHEDQFFDYHFRFWVIPNALNLSNPTVGTSIPFKIWNTFPSVQTLSAINVTGSSVLSFDVSPGATLLDHQLASINMQIGAGENTINASTDFVFTSGFGTLRVIATLGETFPILPEVPVNEEWSFKTDVLTVYNGIESRLSLMPNPRINLTFDVKVVDFDERRTLYNLTSGAIKVASLVPMFQYAAQLTATTSIGLSRIYFDPAQCNARVGKSLLIMNRNTQEVQLGNVTALHADGATIDSAVGVDVSAPLWFAVPAISCFIDDNTGLDFGTQSGTFKLSAFALNDWDLQRPSSGVTISTFDSLPIIEKPFLITTPERWSHRREVLDGGVGLQEMRSADTNFVVKRGLKFSVDRLNGDIDYWREFFALVNGAQKPFLVSTQLPDLTLRLPPALGASQLDIEEKYYESKLYPLDTFKRIQITFDDGTVSNHNITNSFTDGAGDTRITLTPTISLTSGISRICFLQKVRAADSVRLEHYNDYSYVKFGVRSTNN